MKTADLKTKIRAHLANSGEATAKQIAKAIGHADYPTDVINALSDMRTSTEVECEKKKGKGNELWYWLVNAKSDESTELSNLRDQLKNAETQRDAHFASAETAMRRVDELVAESAELRSNRDQLRRDLDDLLVKMADDDKPKTVTEAAVGYIVRVTGKKPRICAKPESAHAAAMSSARAHGRAEVLALVPVGKAVRGAEWKDAA